MRSHSGTGLLVDEVKNGELIEGSKIWDVSRYIYFDSTTGLLTTLSQDSKLEDIKAIDINQPHRKIDLACVTHLIFACGEG